MEVEEAETDEVGSHHQKASHDRAHTKGLLVQLHPRKNGTLTQLSMHLERPASRSNDPPAIGSHIDAIRMAAVTPSTPFARTTGTFPIGSEEHPATSSPLQWSPTNTSSPYLISPTQITTPFLVSPSVSFSLASLRCSLVPRPISNGPANFASQPPDPGPPAP
jgi:hypothetical protein